MNGGEAVRKPHNEEARLKALASYKLLDTAAEQSFDDLVRIACQLCSTSMAGISLIDSDRQWFKSSFGCGLSETPRTESLCSHAILEPGKLMVVPDATLDERFAHLPLVAQEPYLRLYAAAPLVDSEGFALGTLCIADTSPRDLSEQERENLVRLGRQATILLEQSRANRRLAEQTEELVKMHAKAVEMARANTTLLANVGAELGTPLSGLLGVANLLAETSLDQRQAKYVRTITESIEALFGVLDTLLEYAGLEMNGRAVCMGPMRPTDALKEATAAASKIAGAKSLRIDVQYDSASDELRLGDSTIIKRILDHLLNNAVKFTQAGTIQAAVEMFERKADDQNVPEQGGSWLRYSVSDTGIGIHRDMVSLIRARFLSHDFGPIDRSTGFGLGLSVSSHLVDLLGGRLWVESQVGIGSTFGFEIPIGPLLSDSRAGDRHNFAGIKPQ